jgi:hypothetical protein
MHALAARSFVRGLESLEIRLNADGIPKQNDITNVDNEELSIFCKNISVKE